MLYLKLTCYSFNNDNNKDICSLLLFQVFQGPVRYYTDKKGCLRYKITYFLNFIGPHVYKYKSMYKYGILSIGRLFNLNKTKCFCTQIFYHLTSLSSLFQRNDPIKAISDYWGEKDFPREEVQSFIHLQTELSI